jgi:hypothetical protein
MRGAVALHREWLAKDSSSNIAVHVVWSPQLGAGEKHVASATSLIPGVRIKHYWDGEMLVGRAYQPLLALRQPAWDVWLLFDRDAVWRSDTPPPAWWEHQLQEAPPERHLDPVRFAARAAALSKGR